MVCHITCNPTNHTIQLGETDHFPLAWPKNMSSSFLGVGFPSTHSPPPSPAPPNPPGPRFHTTTRHSCSDALLCLFASDQAVLLLQRHRRFLDLRLLGLAPRRGMTISHFFEAFFKLCGCFWQEKKTAVEIFRALHNSCSLLVESQASLKGWRGHTASIDRHR